MGTDDTLNTCEDCGATDKKFAAPIKIDGDVVILCTDCFKVRASKGFKKAAKHVEEVAELNKADKE